MDNIVKITNREWADVTNQVEQLEGEVKELKGKLKRQGDRLHIVETADIRLPQEIGAAITKALEPVLEKVMNHDERFHQLELLKAQEEKERAERLLNEEKERRKWFIRTLIGTILSAIIGPILAILSFLISNNTMP